MSRLITRFVPVLLVLGLAACSNPTSPAGRPLRPSTATVSHDVVPDTTCRSGYGVGQARCGT
ncbi:MAG: hypothetical protein ABI969_00140 [bacterium]